MSADVPPQTVVWFEAYGSPAPQGSKRHVGAGRMIESSAAVKPWREAVKHAAREAREEYGGLTLNGPLMVRMVFTVRKPASAPKTRRVWPAKRPDLSKLIRATEDAITDAGLWADDALVCCYMQTGKQYVGDPGSMDAPGVAVTIWTME